MKQLEAWEVDRMLARLSAVSGQLSAGDLRRLKAIARTAAAIRQLPMVEWSHFEQTISGYEAEPEPTQDETEDAGKTKQADRAGSEREESAALYVRELILKQNDPHPGQRRG